MIIFDQMGYVLPWFIIGLLVRLLYVTERFTVARYLLTVAIHI